MDIENVSIPSHHIECHGSLFATLTVAGTLPFTLLKEAQDEKLLLFDIVCPG
jgi:hypothetical protein